MATLNYQMHRMLKQASAINKVFLTYQKLVFKLTYDFLNNDKPTPK